MKKILLIILALFVLIACSDIVTDPPNSDELTSINKKPPKPDPEPTNLPVVISGDKHIIAGCFKLVKIRGVRKGIVSFRLWTDNDPVPQVREQPGDEISVAIYDVDNDAVDDLLVFVHYSTGKGKNEVRHHELQIWENGEPPSVYEFDGFDVKDIVIGELDENIPGDEIILVGTKEIQIFNPTHGDFDSPPIKTISTGQYNVFGKSTTLGDADNDSDIDIVFASINPFTIIVSEYPSGNLSEIPISNKLCDRIQVADVDNDNYNEIIWGGALGYLHIIEDNINNSNYEDKWVSEDLGGYLFGIEVANFDSDEDLEIAVGTTGGTPNIVAVYNCLFDNSNNFLGCEKTTLSTSIERTVDMIAVNADNDEQKEFMLGTINGVRVYDYSNGYYTIFNESVEVTPVTSIYLK